MNEHVLEDAINYIGDDVVEHYLEKKVSIKSRKTKNSFLGGGIDMNENPNRNKWWITIAIAAVLLIAAVVIAIVGGSHSQNPVVNERPADGPETGVYYYDTAEGEYLLTLNSGNSRSKFE